ncbi:MAG: signal peptidase I [Peptococcaceae bacterium]|nr:signal peptidase I [Peptococcaceae bacterium]
MADTFESFSEKKEEKKTSIYRDILESIVIAVLLALIVRAFLFQPFYIPSGSMEPTLQINDEILVNKFGYRVWDLERGDIVVFKYPGDPSKDYVKRLIGLPGEKFELKNNKLYIDGQEISESYLPKDMRFNDFGPETVPEKAYLMLGDNRNNSEDSRYWGFLPQENVIGKAMFIFWPLDHMKILRSGGN